MYVYLNTGITSDQQHCGTVTSTGRNHLKQKIKKNKTKNNKNQPTNKLFEYNKNTQCAMHYIKTQRTVLRASTKVIIM